MVTIYNGFRSETLHENNRMLLKGVGTETTTDTNEKNRNTEQLETEYKKNSPNCKILDNEQNYKPERKALPEKEPARTKNLPKAACKRSVWYNLVD